MTLHEPEIAPVPGRSRVWTDLALIVCVIALALLGAIVIGVEMSRLAASPGPCLAPR
ncbi:hypothetical protein [Actinomadura sp.]|uniref:hypothetical protein n=1 Tax=Actinomadura sp. TaxID=1989 RepID=UPI00335876A2